MNLFIALIAIAFYTFFRVLTDSSTHGKPPASVSQGEGINYEPWQNLDEKEY